jgi:hypothetical protein
MKKAEQHFMSKRSLTFIAGTYFEFIKAMRNYEYSNKEVKTKILELRKKATSFGVEKTLEQYLEEI